MKYAHVRGGMLALIILLPSLVAKADGDLTKQKPVELTMQLGDKKNHLRFYPDTLTLKTGKLYKLTLKNPSQDKHYFSSAKLAGAVFTRKVQVYSADGKTAAEVKGVVREIEVYPNGTAEWWFVPVKTGNFSDLHCSIFGHTEAGMKGRIVIE